MQSLKIPLVGITLSAESILYDLCTGEMLASIHFKVMGDYQSVLQPGCVLVLQQVSCCVHALLH